eukprot:TRINITY_DN2110_c0_g1_i10.p1 TRINITY_DN2110_c0_g1~~TRINITY_DN2110_c0_g1_i10.p1  ORF type:complete len:200 (-),score=16.35 TRINITY_DN2110_c0_g1_i10:113-712(-)
MAFRYLDIAKKKGLDKDNVTLEYLSDPEFKEGSELYGNPTEILPHLYLGSEYNARTPHVIQHYNIAFILNVAEEISYPVLGHDGNYHKIVIKDYVDSPQYHVFEEAFQLIDHCLNQGKKCLIHCARGRSRSATVVIAYLMHRQKMMLREAFMHVKQLRPQIGPHASLKYQLLDYQIHLYKKPDMDEKTVKHFLTLGYGF